MSRPDCAAERGAAAAAGTTADLVDTHCHLDQFEDPHRVMLAAAAAGVETLVAVGENPASNRAVLDLRRARPGRVVAGVGLHPAWVVEQPPAAVEAALEGLPAQLADADLLGEIGLDHKWARTADQRRFQEETLDRQLALAAVAGKPINLHSRRCQRQVMEKAIGYCRETGLAAQLHWFTQSKKLVRICNDEGLFISVGPTVLTDLQAREVAAHVADDLLLLESDAPVPVGGVPGHPRRVLEVATALAELKRCPVAEVARLTRANFSRFLTAGSGTDGSGRRPGCTTIKSLM